MLLYSVPVTRYGPFKGFKKNYRSTIKLFEQQKGLNQDGQATKVSQVLSSPFLCCAFSIRGYNSRHLCDSSVKNKQHALLLTPILLSVKATFKCHECIMYSHYPNSKLNNLRVHCRLKLAAQQPSP